MWWFLGSMVAWVLLLSFFSLKMATAALITTGLILLIFSTSPSARNWAADIDDEISDEELYDSIVEIVK